MIKSFADKNTEKLYITGKNSKIKAAIINTALRKLDYLNASNSINDLRISPGNRLKLLRGNLAGKYSIRINDQYRIVFNFEKENAYNVEIKDYH